MDQYLKVNDTGARNDPLGRAQAASEALVQEKSALSLVENRDEAQAAIRRYLRTWRHGHLWVTDSLSNKSKRAPPPPTFEVLSPTSLVIRLPSFDASLAKAIAELLDRHRFELESHENWILDIRGGEGGSDDTYTPLLHWLMPDDWRSIGAEFLATPLNADAHERVCREAHLPDGATEVLMRLAASIRGAKDGEFVRLEEEKQGFAAFCTVRDGRKRPARVAILADNNVGSSSEEFILTARSSPLVRVFGQRTAGVLDYSNCRPWPLPSGERTLWYATSRSLRLPAHPVDGIGVVPDRHMPKPANQREKVAELESVRRIIEREPDYWRT
ncbi:MAG: S41 family peptidase [Burkholderiales bacterium]